MARPRRRWLTALALASSCAISISACSSSTGAAGSPGDGKGTIEFWTMPYWTGENDKIKELVEEFNASQKDVKVNLTLLEYKDGREKIKQAIAAGTGPDVWMMNNGLDADYLDAGSLASLDSLGYTGTETDRFLDLAKVNEHQGKYYGAPLYFDVGVMVYNPETLKKYGRAKPPATWAELKSTATTITRESSADGSDISGWQFKGMDDHVNGINSTWESFLCAAGGSLTSPDYKKSTQNSEAGRTTMDYMRSFYADKTSPVGTSALNGFIDGKVAMFPFFQSVAMNIKAAGPKAEGKWALAPMPAGPKSGCSMVGGHSLVASAQGEDLKAAGTFIKYMTSPEMTARYMEFLGIFPYKLDKVDPAIKAEHDKRVKADPVWKPILEQLGRNSPDLVLQDRHGWSTRWEAQKANIVAGVGGQLPVDEALRNLDSQVDQALSAAK
ncbi:extracellular solute-binding protein [Streptomyces sp. NPDC055051]